MEYLAILDHFSLFEPACGQSLDSTSTLIDKNVINRYCFNEIYGEGATLCHYHPIFPPFARNHFFCYCPHLCLHIGNPLTPSLLLLTKMLSLGAVAMISTEKEQLQTISTPFFHHMPQIQFLAIFDYFSPFLPTNGRPHDPTSALIY